MPPRHAYWTILIDNAPTAFRAREKEDLLPTLNQLRRTNNDVLEMVWAREVVDTPEAAHGRSRTDRARRKRDATGARRHTDIRDRFKKGPGKRRHDAKPGRRQGKARQTSRRSPPLRKPQR
jgi:hypothetical protein